MRQYSLLIFLLTLSCCNNIHNSNTKNISVDTISKSNDKVNQTLNTTNGKLIKFNSQYNFTSFKVEQFNGELALPNFAKNRFSSDKEYVKFITDGCKSNSINFGGHYTIIQKSCGAMCELIFVVDRKNGEIYTDITPNDGRYGYMYKKDSKLLIANSNVFQDDSLKYYNDFFAKPELYVWNDNKFKLLQ
jgi:hypothetical protein